MKSRILSTDEIVAMSDDELSRRSNSLNGYIDRERRRGNRQSVHELELEYCYLYREAEVRDQRRKAHEEWLMNGGIASLEELDQQDFYA